MTYANKRAVAKVSAHRDAPRWLPRLIYLLKLPPPSQIITPRPINEYVFYPAHKETLFPVIFRKIGSPTEIEYFQHGPRSLD